jgi:hypothetical protein
MAETTKQMKNRLWFIHQDWRRKMFWSLLGLTTGWAIVSFLTGCRTAPPVAPSVETSLSTNQSIPGALYPPTPVSKRDSFILISPRSALVTTNTNRVPVVPITGIVFPFHHLNFHSHSWIQSSVDLIHWTNMTADELYGFPPGTLTNTDLDPLYFPGNQIGSFYYTNTNFIKEPIKFYRALMQP